MNLGQIKDRVLRSINYEYTDTFHLVDLINEGLNILVDSGKLKDKVTLSVLPQVNMYPLPNNFRAPGILQDETVVDAIIPYELVDISENRYGYAIESGNMYIKPMPTQAVTLTHYYYKFANPLVNDEDIPTDIDTQYHSSIALYAISMILPTLNTDTTTRYAVTAATMADQRAWQNWTTALNNFIEANTKKSRNSRVREKVVW
jgi:hypothetical protein